LLPSESHDRLRAATRLLRAALADQRAMRLPKTADLVQRTLADAEQLLLSAPELRRIELEVLRAEQVLGVWNALLAF